MHLNLQVRSVGMKKSPPLDRIQHACERAWMDRLELFDSYRKRGSKLSTQNLTSVSSTSVLWQSKCCHRISVLQSTTKLHHSNPSQHIYHWCVGHCSPPGHKNIWSQPRHEARVIVPQTKPPSHKATRLHHSLGDSIRFVWGIPVGDSICHSNPRVLRA